MMPQENEQAMSKQRKGRPPAPPPLVIGVDLGGTQIRAALIQQSQLLSRVSTLTQDEEGAAAVLQRIKAAIRHAAQQAGVPLEQVRGIGIAAPGPLDSRSGIIISPPNLKGWRNVPLRQIIHDEFQIPTALGHDASVAALAEHVFGAGRGTPDMIYLTVSTGIGGGVLLGGKIMEGTSGVAPEPGHMTIDRHGPRCNCGNIGCLEALASGTAIARHAAEAIAQGQGQGLLEAARALHVQEVDARVVVEAARRGDQTASAIMRAAAESVGIGLVNLIHIFNPALLVIGGGVAQAGPLLFEPVQRIVNERAMEVQRRAVRIVPAELGEDAGLLGAAANLLQPQTIR
jgi:glucokinase